MKHLFSVGIFTANILQIVKSLNAKGSIASSILDIFYCILFHPITLEGRRGTTDEFAAIPFHLVLFSAAQIELAKSIPVHSGVVGWCNGAGKSRKENPQKLTRFSSRSHPRILVGKRTVKKDTIIDITSDSQVNSNFPNRWSPASLTFNNYFYLFLYLYIT